MPPWRKHWDFIRLDFLSGQLSFILAFLIFQHGWIYSDPRQVHEILAVVLLMSQAVVILFTEPFKDVLKRSPVTEFVKTLYHTVMVVAAAVIILFIIHQAGRVSRLVVGIGAIFYFVIAYLSRIGLIALLKKHSLASYGTRSVVTITTKAMADDVIEHFNRPEFRDIKLHTLVIADEMNPSLDLGPEITVIGAEEPILDYLCHAWVDEVFIDLPEGEHLPDEVIAKILNMGITVHTCVISNVSIGKQYLEKLGSYAVLTSSNKIVTARQMFAKRVLDLIGGFVGSVIAVILMIFVGPIIFIKSPGHIFFKQTRIGKNGKKFKMYKFRSMYPDAEERKKEYMAQNKIEDGLMFKMDNDPRIIKGIGNFIRRTSIDEFPQFFNVLRGEMSIVGTRPPTVDEWEQYGLEHRVRMSIKPGITGLWQVSGRSKITDFDEVVRLDSEYIQDWTLWEDIEIVFKTIGVVVKRDGAE